MIICSKYLAKDKIRQTGDFLLKSFDKKMNSFELSGLSVPSNVVSTYRGRFTEGQKTSRGQWNITGTLTKSKTTKKPKVVAPPCAGAFQERHVLQHTQFRTIYDRGDLPISVDSSAMGIKIKWRTEVSRLDLHNYLPLFFDGLREVKEPYVAIATQGIRDILNNGGDKIVTVVPQLIIPMKRALETRNIRTMCNTLKAIQQLVLSADHVGEALLPFYRQLLPVMNTFKHHNVNTGDGIDYSQGKQTNIGDAIDETLGILETHGGEDAYINIKYMIPTYESCVLN